MDKITEQMLRMKHLSNDPVDVTKLEPIECDPVELTEQEWKDTNTKHKIVLEGKEHVISFQNTFVLKPVTITTDDGGKAPSTNKMKDYEGDGGDAEKTNKKMVDNDQDGGTEMVKEDELSEDKKQATKDYDGDGEIETSEEEWKGSRDKAIKKSKSEEVKEGSPGASDDQVKAAEMIHNHLTHGKKKYSYGGNESLKDKDEREYKEMMKKKAAKKKDPDSFIKKGSLLKNAKIGEQYENNQEFSDEDADEYYGLDGQRDEKVKIPKQLTTSINSKIKEISASIDHYDNKGYNDGDGENSNKIKAIDALEQIKSNLSLRNVEGLKQAQLFFLTLMSPITDLFPADVVNFLSNGNLEDGPDGGELDKVEPFETELKESFGRKNYMFTNKKRFDQYFNNEILPNSGINDAVAYREAYINYVDGLVRDETLPPSAVDWVPPEMKTFPVRESVKPRSISEILAERKKAKKDPCWKGYTQVGMKKKNGKEVPNCVPSEDVEPKDSDK